jgi:hypothetical protein
MAKAAGFGDPALQRRGDGEEDEARGEVAEHFAAGAGVVDVPQGDQGAEEGVGAVFDGFGPRNGKERGRSGVERDERKLGGEERGDETLEAAEFAAASDDGAFFVFDT